MTPYEVSDIKTIRKKLGLTQSMLASKSGVSQSLIAKIEMGNIDPAYSNVRKIFSALETLQKKDSLQARDFIHKGVIYCCEDDTVKDVIKKMNRYEISQLPVMKKGNVVGVVSESKIVSRLIDSPPKELKAKDVMGDVPPMVSLNTPESAISSLLNFFSLVLVQDKGKLKGIITRSDLLRKVYS